MIAIQKGLLFVMFAVCFGSPFTVHAVERVSVDSLAIEANGPSGRFAPPRMSADGRFVVFESNADNLVPNDTNGAADIFVHDRITGMTERASIASDGSEAISFSQEPAISGDGRFVAFNSPASNLVPDDHFNNDVFVYDRLNATIERVSVGPSGEEADPGANSFGAAISADGRFVAFTTSASNFDVDWDPDFDVFVKDRLTGSIERANVASDGSQSAPGLDSNRLPAISADGRFVAFFSAAANLVADDTNGTTDLFVHDRLTGATERVDVASDGGQASIGAAGDKSPAISADGRFVAFTSRAQNLYTTVYNGRDQIFVRDRLAGLTEQITVGLGGTTGNSDSGNTSISGDGRFVAFQSCSTNLVVGDTSATCDDVFVHDRQTGTMARVSLAFDGGEASGNGSDLIVTAMSGDGRFVSWDSGSTNLVPADTNGVHDVFVAANPLANRSPSCAAAVLAPVSTLWPPNHALVRLAVAGISDPDGDPINMTVTQITQDEPLLGQGSGDKCPDGMGIGGATAIVRAERNGTGDGRVYHVHFEATDGRGGSCIGMATACVPHDMGKGSTCTDQHTDVNATGPCQ